VLRTILRLGLGFLSSGFAFAQGPDASTPRETLAATLADLHGLGEAIDGPVAENPIARTALSFSIVDGRMVSPRRLPAQESASAGTVSAKRLQHRAPKAAREAYEKAAKLARKKDVLKAAKELERAIGLDPGFAEAHDDLGVAYACLGRYPEAELELRRTIELIPEESLPRSNLAWVLLAMGRRAEAEANVRRAIQLSPDSASAHLLLGRLLMETQDTLAEGLRHLEYAARTIPEAKQIAKALNGK